MKSNAVIIVIASGALAAGSAVAMAVPAAAYIGITTPGRPAQVWHQSYQRATAEEPCVAPAWETPWNDSWDAADRTWKPSWEEWANNGQGGWVCTRSITWDPGAPPTTVRFA